jgi:hypothetical protein
VGFDLDGNVRIVDSIDGCHIYSIEPVAHRRLIPEVLEAVHEADGGATFAAAGRRFVGRWDARTGALLARIEVGSQISGFSASRDARIGAFTRYETSGLLWTPFPDVHVVDFELGREVARLDLAAAVETAIAVSPDGARLYVAVEQEIVGFRIPDLVEVDRLSDPARALSFDPLGRLIIGGDGWTAIDLTTRERHVLDAGDVNVTWSRDGRYLAHDSPRGVHFRQLATLEDVGVPIDLGWLLVFALSHDGKQIVAADHAGRVVVRPTRLP